VATLVAVPLALGVYHLLDSSNRLSKQETEVAEAQQSLRIGISEVTRIIRQARVGGLYYGNAVLPLANNSAGGTSLSDLSGVPHFIRKGTDVIGARGILFGDRYELNPGDVACGGSCATTTEMTVTIRATPASGFVNFASGGAPSLSNKTRPFYFTVVDGSNQTVTVGGSSYLVPLYVVGLVNTTGSWYTRTAGTFVFKMNPQDAGARKWNATTAPFPATLVKPLSGGPVDEIRFFVDEGASDFSGTHADTHSTLAEAILDPGSGRYDVQPLLAEVEDFQVAYGIDGIDGSAANGGVSATQTDVSGFNRDEWVGNVATEIETTLPISSTAPPRVDGFLDTSVAGGASDPAVARPALRSVWISLVVKSTDPEIVFNGPGARGLKTLDSIAVSFSDPSSMGRPYRRRSLSLAVALRNYE
jgi:hypothetical protein